MDLTAVNQVTNALGVNDGTTVSWTLAGTFTGSAVLESSAGPVTGPWKEHQTLDSETTSTFKHEGSRRWYRVRCTVLGEAETITATISEVAGQIAQTFYDDEGIARLDITDAGATVYGTMTATDFAGDLTGSLTGTHTGNAAMGSLVCTAQDITASGAISANTSLVRLNKTDGVLAVTNTPTTGRFLVITQIDAGTQGHTVTLAPGTWDGTNNTATFNAPGETLVVFALSNTRYAIILNLGAVALSNVA